MISIGVLVTNYNSWSLALDCIGEHRRLHGASLRRVVLLDDCSTSEPPSPLPDGFDLIRNEHNRGFAASLNRGVRAVDTEVVVIFDADAFPLTPYLEAVATAFTDDPQLGLLGFETVGSDGRLTASTLPEPDAGSLVLGQKLDDLTTRWLRRSRGGALCITTAAMAVRRQAFEEVGRFDERLNWLDVDVDFSMRINRSSWTLRVQPGLVARHDTGGTPMSTAEKVRRFYASRWYLLRKHKVIAYPIAVKVFILARIGLELLILWSLGWLIHRGNLARYSDKLDGRLRLLNDCWHHYE